MKKCKLCNKSKHMKKLIDKEFKIFDERHSFCYKCKPTLDSEDYACGQVDFMKRNGRFVILNVN